MMNKPALLVLADGSIYKGISVGAEGERVGELVFNTAMTGYQEILTDPSYAQQIVTLTTTHVGNTGCNSEDMESTKAWASGLVVRHCSATYSNFRAEQSLSEWLKQHNVVAISEIDTRDLTIKLRDQGAMSACLTTKVENPQLALEKAQSFNGLQGMDLAAEVSRQTTERWYSGRGAWTKNTLPQRFHIIAYDFGVKHNILRILHDKGCHITLVPAKTSAKEALAMKPDGILLSNGPGDPQACGYAIEATKRFLEENIPLFGICLGFQILALACGANTIKMKFGHHGANHPVVETSSRRRVFITSQNHGFAVDETSLPNHLQVTHRSLFDNSLQGVRCTHKPAFGFQGHPEAGPGPHDIEVIFDEFIEAMKQGL